MLRSAEVTRWPTLRRGSASRGRCPTTSTMPQAMEVSTIRSAAAPGSPLTCTNESTMRVIATVWSAKWRVANGSSAPPAPATSAGHHEPVSSRPAPAKTSTPATVPAKRLTVREKSGPRSGLTRKVVVAGSQYQCSGRSSRATAALAAMQTATRRP